MATSHIERSPQPRPTRGRVATPDEEGALRVASSDQQRDVSTRRIALVTHRNAERQREQVPSGIGLLSGFTSVLDHTPTAVSHASRSLRSSLPSVCPRYTKRQAQHTQRPAHANEGNTLLHISTHRRVNASFSATSPSVLRCIYR
ncbi:hypothetical protein AAFF_G00430670 [Aldrovandia affinis]|uniref:Uncharacterized protein n=1 Tax=Aldrovandia affinis TaxID=143900 RepID=A0AAD7S9F1_9TELE|nr:hypothetical protein AAFF_G00430670 [Aldrovandia affinis]